MPTMLKHRLAGIFIIAALAFAAPGEARADQVHKAGTEKEIRIGVLAFRGGANALKRWSATADYLTGSIEGYRFAMVPLSLENMNFAAYDESVDFILTNTGNYVNLEARFGVSRIATMRAPTNVAAGNVFGAVIFSRADRQDIRTLSDLRGKSFMAVKRNGFGGFQMAWRELKEKGIDPFSDFSRLRFSGFPQDVVAFKVESGEVDAGTFRTDTLEKMAAEGKIKMSNFRVLNPKKYPGFPFEVSTRLYPEWPFAKLKGTPDPLAQKVAIALLSMPSDGQAAKAGGYGGWTVPLDYQPVHDLFRFLRIGPYEDLGEIRFNDIVKQYGHWVLLGFFGLIIFAVWGTWTEYLVTRRTRELSDANRELEKEVIERERAEDEARRRQAELAHVSRLNTMGEMASGFAHELNQPLSAIINYAQGCVRRMKRGAGETEEMLAAMEQVSVQAGRAGEIIRRIRSFVRKDEPERNRVDVASLIRDVTDLLGAEFKRSGVTVTLTLSGALPFVMADAIQIEQVVLNLVRNAIEAMDEGGSKQGGSKEKRLIIKISEGDNETVCVAVEDTGPGISEETRDHAFDPFVTTKKGGLGLGLSISQSIIEGHGGRLFIERSRESGTVFMFSLPAAVQANLKQKEERRERA